VLAQSVAKMMRPRAEEPTLGLAGLALLTPTLAAKTAPGRQSRMQPATWSRLSSRRAPTAAQPILPARQALALLASRQRLVWRTLLVLAQLATWLVPTAQHAARQMLLLALVLHQHALLAHTTPRMLPIGRTSPRISAAPLLQLVLTPHALQDTK